MLRASATHPAMMGYLDNARARRTTRTRTTAASCSSCTRSASTAATTEEDMRQSTAVLTGLRRRLGHGRVRVPRLGTTTPGRSTCWASRRQQERGQGRGRRPRLRATTSPITRRPPSASPASSATASSPTTRRRRSSTRSPRPTSTTTRRSCRCSRSCSAPRRSTSSVGEKVRRPFEDVAAPCGSLGIRPDPEGVRRACRVSTG